LAISTNVSASGGNGGDKTKHVMGMPTMVGAMGAFSSLDTSLKSMIGYSGFLSHQDAVSMGHNYRPSDITLAALKQLGISREVEELKQREDMVTNVVKQVDERNVLHIMGVSSDRTRERSTDNMPLSAISRVSSIATFEIASESVKKHLLHMKPRIFCDTADYRWAVETPGFVCPPLLEGCLKLSDGVADHLGIALETRLSDILDLLVREATARHKQRRGQADVDVRFNAVPKHNRRIVVDADELSAPTGQSSESNVGPSPFWNNDTDEPSVEIDLEDIESCFRLNKLPLMPPDQLRKLGSMLTIQRIKQRMSL